VWSDKFGVIGPYLFEDEDGRAITVISAHYAEILWNFLTPQLNRCGIELWTIWFQQDGATAHTVRAAIYVAREIQGHGKRMPGL
jgi:hypothetical protein